MGDCHKCKYEITAECIKRSQEMKWPNCFQGIVTHYDLLIRKTPEELAEFLWSIGASPFNGAVYINGKPIFSTAQGNKWLDWLKSPAEEGET